ncbi:MAG: SURF1 family protein [Pseudomonadales bacterium]|jgi:cytochrome oxidase assembly protein ShyY1|nr:SURF1 family protein [Pseudomonadales bacterium]
MWQRLRHYRFDWKLTLLYVLLLPLLLRLGFWQLAREEEKRELLAVYESRQQEAPVALAALNPADDLQYRQVHFTGHPDNAHFFLLDNRIYRGQVGYEVLQAVRTEADAVVFINRGWAAQGATRADLPVLAPLPDPLEVRGSVYVPVGDPVVLGAAMSDGWPRVIEVLDLPQMQAAAAFAGLRFPYTVRVAEGAAGALVRYWPVINLSPEMHRGYAVQWFAMALALTLLYLFYSTRPSELKS